MDNSTSGNCSPQNENRIQVGMVERRTVEERRVIRISAVENMLSRKLERHRVRPTGITNCPASQTAGR